MGLVAFVILWARARTSLTCGEPQRATEHHGGVAAEGQPYVAFEAMLRLRSRVRARIVGGWLLAGGVLGTVLCGACADQKGALMLAVNTDMKAPKDVNAVSVTISTNGAIKHSFIGRVTPQGEVLLPATLAIVQPDDANATIRVRVVAFQERKPRVLRDVRTTVPTGGRTAMLRIPLNFVNDASAVGPNLPTGILPDPFPGTGGGTPAVDGGDNSGAAFGSSAGDFDFLNAWHPPCPNIDTDTIIDGECRDSYIDPSTLPDFDSSALGDSTDSSSCFDLAKCFAGSAPVGEGTSSGGDGGASSSGDAGALKDASAPGPADGGGAGDAGAKFKDFATRAITLDRNTCTLQLNGANPQRVNLALVTPDAGECVRPGECYVPIDHGPGGWKEENGRVQLPSYVCKLLGGKNLRLATSSDVCAAKKESNPICTPKPGDATDAGAVDSGPAASGFAITEDWPTAVAVVGGTLFFASQSRVGQVVLGAGSASPQPIPGVTAAGSARLPWRFGTSGGLALANGTDTGFVIAGGPTGTVTIAPNTIDVAPVGGRFIWGVSGGQGGLFGSPPSPATRLDVPVLDVTALLASKLPNTVLVADAAGGVRACATTASVCGHVASVGGRIDALAPRDDTSAYALGVNGVFRVTIDSATQDASTQLVVADSNPGIQDGALYFPHALAASGPCIVYSSAEGLRVVVDSGQTPSAVTGAFATPDRPILGVAIGPDTSKSGLAAYYTVFGPRDTNGGAPVSGGARGGGIYKISLPPECGSSASTKDGGIAADSGPPCVPKTCAELGYNCGVAGNGCGGTVTCGMCGGATPNCVANKCQ